MEPVPVAGNRSLLWPLWSQAKEGWRISALRPARLAAWYDEPHDYLGQLFSEQNCAIDGIGQVMTPPCKAGWPPLTLGRSCVMWRYGF